MGMDVVELVMRVEETFGIELPDDEAATATTVGGLYRLVLEKLNLPYRPAVEIEDEMRPIRGQDEPWNTPSVWTKLKETVVDQLQVDEDEVLETASFQDDLGAV